MSTKYKVKVIFEIKDGKKSARFRTDLKLPFVPTKETVVTRKDAVAIPLGPFEKVTYNYDDKYFVCWIPPWSPDEDSKNKDGDVRQVIENLLTEGWTRIDMHGLDYLLKE
jgi:hypothetical protein